MIHSYRNSSFRRMLEIPKNNWLPKLWVDMERKSYPEPVVYASCAARIQQMYLRDARQLLSFYAYETFWLQWFQKEEVLTGYSWLLRDAVEAADSETVLKLIKHNFDLERLDADKRTVFCHAVQNDCVLMVKLLLKAGAEMNVMVYQGTHLATFIQSEAVCDLFADHMDRLNSEGKEIVMDNRLRLLFA